MRASQDGNGRTRRITQGDIEPAGKELEKPGKSSQERELQLVVVSQVDQDRPQAGLQSIKIGSYSSPRLFLASLSAVAQA